MSQSTLEVLTHRGSCRRFLDRPIPEPLLEQVLTAGIQAPSGGNLQPFAIIRVEHPEAKERLAQLCANQQFIASAPVNLLFCMDWRRLERWAALSHAPFAAHRSFRHFWISFQDTVIAAHSICVAADAVGLGSVYVGTVIDCLPDLKTMFHLPPRVFPVVLLCLGYRAEPVAPRPKLGLDTIVCRETYREFDDAALAAAYARKYADIRVEVTEQHLTRIEEVGHKVHGADFAARCLQEIKEAGWINAAQRYFGLHYRADRMSENNLPYRRIMQDFGFDWLEGPES